LLSIQVRVLFNMARHYAPSIIFFDEADALLSARGGDGEHEVQRRKSCES
jgi:katanin p60 ATPase-containing subunit A1